MTSDEGVVQRPCIPQVAMSQHQGRQFEGSRRRYCFWICRRAGPGSGGFVRPSL